MLKSRREGKISHSPALNRRRQRWEHGLYGMRCYSQQGFALTKPLFFQFTSFSKLITDLLLCAIHKELKKKHHANMHGTGTYFIKAITLHRTYNYCM